MRSPQFIQHSVWLRMRILDHRVPRAPLPDTGVTRNGMTSQIIWKGITPSSSLIWTHAPDQSPPRASGFPSHTWSLQVVTSPCWAMAFPDIISTTLVQVLGSIPRRDLQVLVPISSLETPASPHGKQVRLTDISLLNSFNREPSFEAAIIRLPSGSYTRLALILSLPQQLCVHQADRPFTPRIACPVTRYKMWRHYMTDLGNCHGWSSTSWVAALSAAPFRIRFLSSQFR